MNRVIVGLLEVCFVILGFTASLVSAVFGFGTALLVLALGSYLLPVQTTIVLATVLFAASTITKTIVFGKHIDWRVAGIMAIASLPFAFGGALLMTEVPTHWLQRLLGGMILLYVILNRFQLFPKFRINTSGLILGSAGYGFVSGLLGSGNLIKALIFREMNITKEAFVGAMAATSVLSNVAKLSAYTHSGLLDIHLLYPAAGLIVSALIAVLLGKKILRKMNHNQFETGLQIVLAVSAIGLIV
ncbi:MAG: sulfite exporter TauE/SafE family protein [Pseudomonadota bacterium]